MMRRLRHAWDVLNVAAGYPFLFVLDCAIVACGARAWEDARAESDAFCARLWRRNATP